MIEKQTFLPVFSGFYDTVWEASDDIEYELEDWLPESGYKIPKKHRSPEHVRGIAALAWDFYDSSQYEADNVKAVCDCIENDLKELGVIVGLRYEEIVHPRQYNFRNDSVNITVFMTRAQEIKIRGLLIKKEAEFSKWVKDNFTSRPGFISFHSNDYKDWINPESDEYFMEGEYKIGAVLGFLLLQEYGEEYELDLYHACATGALQYFDIQGMIDQYKANNA